MRVFASPDEIYPLRCVSLLLTRCDACLCFSCLCFSDISILSERHPAGEPIVEIFCSGGYGEPRWTVASMKIGYYCGRLRQMIPGHPGDRVVRHRARSLPKRQPMIRSRSFISSCMFVAAITIGSDGRTSDEPSPLTIEGYTDRLSYRAGESVSFHISTTAGRYSMEIARLGAETKVVLPSPTSPARPIRSPRTPRRNGCNWPVSHRLTVPGEWKSGYYNVRLSVADNGGKYVGRNRRTAEVDLFFIVRSAEPGRTRRSCSSSATNTYNAYTNWGGSSLYAYHGRAGLQGHRVSFDRPIDSQFRQWELPFVAWAERQRIHARLLRQQRPGVPPRAARSLQAGPQRRPRRVLVGPDAGPPGSVHRPRRKRRLLQRQYLLLAGPQRGRRPGPDLLEAVVQPGPGLPDGRSSDAHHALEPSPGQAAREPAHRRRLPPRRLPPQPRPVHGRQGGLHRPPPRALDLRGDQA